MSKKLIFILILITPFLSNSQKLVPVLQQGEIGISVGRANYFGDLNEKANIKHNDIAYSVFYRKNLGNYVAGRFAISYCKIGYKDEYNTYNKFKYLRNLSFESKVVEVALQGDFNFFAFLPGVKSYNFTPYITLGVGVMTYNPYTYLSNIKYYLRQYHTEGQGSDLYPSRKEYKKSAYTLPIGVGVKWALNRRINIGLEFLYRLTTTDYLDDVSTTYPDVAAFDNMASFDRPIALQLYDRSSEKGTVIGVVNRQRGNSRQFDQFATASFFVCFNLQDYECPKVNIIRAW